MEGGPQDATDAPSSTVGPGGGRLGPGSGVRGVRDEAHAAHDARDQAAGGAGGTARRKQRAPRKRKEPEVAEHVGPGTGADAGDAGGAASAEDCAPPALRAMRQRRPRGGHGSKPRGGVLAPLPLTGAVTKLQRGPGRTINARAESALAALLESLSCVKPSGAAAPAAEGQHLQHSGSSAEA